MARPKTNPPRTRWEYMESETRYALEPKPLLLPWLNKLGKDGWEVVRLSVTGFGDRWHWSGIFKRPVPEKPKRNIFGGGPRNAC
jgi:hypothetical protein